MRDILDVWKKPRQLVLASYTAAIYAAVLIPFKYGLPLVPGFTEIRPGVTVLFLCSFLFGPAAAWGGAFGNLIGDFFGGTLGASSVFGFVGNFFLGYFPYRAWELMKGGRPVPSASPLWWIKYVLSLALASGACAGTIAWGLDWLFKLPFIILGDIIFINNMIMAILLTPLLLGLIVPRMEAWGYTYSQMEPDRAEPGIVARVGLTTAFASTGLLMLAGNVLARASWTNAFARWLSPPSWIVESRSAVLAPLILLLVVGTVFASFGKAVRKKKEEIDTEEKYENDDGGGIVIDNLCFSYVGHTTKALDGVSLEINPGEFTVIMGRTGAGKTTLARCITGAVPHFYPGDLDGIIRVVGCDPANDGPALNAHAVGMVFEDFESQLFSTNVDLETAFGPENLGMSQKDITDSIASSLSEVGLEGYGDRDPSELSGGEKQRLAIAATLSMKSPILILDEPTTDLDPMGREELFNVLDGLKKSDRTVIVIEHEADVAKRADRVVLMKDGQIDATREVGDMPTSPDLLEDHGVRAGDSIKLLDALDMKNGASDVEAVANALAETCSVDSEKYENLISGPKKLAESYGDELIRIEGLRYSYRAGHEALKGVDLTVRKGEFLALLGHNGSGKTTLAKHLNGLLKPSAGSVTLEGESVSGMRLSEVAGRVGYVFQNPDHQIFSTTVAEEVAFAPTNFGLSRDEIERRVADALEATGLVGRERTDPFHMTKGERQRVAVAGVLAGAPEVIILDEPTTGLDLDEQRSVMELLKKLNEEGHTVIIITHTVWVAAEYAHRTVLMADGKVLTDGSTREVFGMEEPLEKARVVRPQATSIGLKAFGKVFVSVEELLSCVKRSAG